MAATEELQVSHAVSRDGTKIGYFSSGMGPPLLLIHGGVGDHHRWETLRPYLTPHFTVHAMDRRGRGASGDGGDGPDGDDYTIEREYDDVAAVIEAIAAEAKLPVDVYGHSYGGFVAFGGVPRAEHVRRLVLYEGWPLADPAGLGLPESLLEKLEGLLADGDPEGAVEALFRDAVGSTEEELATVRAQPSWPHRVAAAHTIPRELRAEPRFDPDAAAKITVPTLLLVGGDAPERFQPAPVLDAIGDVRLEHLDGQEHEADIVAPERVAEQLLAFLQPGR